MPANGRSYFFRNLFEITQCRTIGRLRLHKSLLHVFDSKFLILTATNVERTRSNDVLP